MELNDILKAGVKNSASDIHLKVGLPPILRIDGKLVPLKVPQPLRPEDVKAMCAQIFANEEQRDRFERNREADCSYSVPGLGRFRVNVFLQRSTVGIAIRVIPIGVLSFEGLNLPKVIEKLAMETRGLILCTGTTGSGKSPPLAPLVEYIHYDISCHVITLAHPIASCPCPRCPPGRLPFGSPPRPPGRGPRRPRGERAAGK